MLINTLCIMILSFLDVELAGALIFSPIQSSTTTTHVLQALIRALPIQSRRLQTVYVLSLVLHHHVITQVIHQLHPPVLRQPPMLHQQTPIVNGRERLLLIHYLRLSL